MPQFERTEDGQAAKEAVAPSLRGKLHERVAYTHGEILSLCTLFAPTIEMYMLR